MALIKEIEEGKIHKAKVHNKVNKCTYRTFKDADGNTYLQIDTYGSKERQDTDKISQSMQFDFDSAKQLLNLIKDTFSLE